jgi:hypothetical protein
MISNQISPFEYVSILVSIILGLGITQVLSPFSDLLYNHKKVAFYWPHTIWIVFVLFLHIQDWFVTYQLRGKMGWRLPELTFVLLYPITLFVAAKMLLPTNDEEERYDMKHFYYAQFPMIFLLISISIILSIAFNMIFLAKGWGQQAPLMLFLGIVSYLSFKKVQDEVIHKALALILLLAVVWSVILEDNVWIIN